MHDYSIVLRKHFFWGEGEGLGEGGARVELTLQSVNIGVNRVNQRHNIERGTTTETWVVHENRQVECGQIQDR